MSGSSAVGMVTDGRCITSTLAVLEEGTETSKPMPREALEATRQQAASLLEQILNVYESDVARGEVGADGSAAASTDPPLSKRCPTGLLYGRIQSGKTVAMIALAALAIDNGFRIVVVLTSDNVKLVEQTASRFSALEGMVKSSTLSATWPAEANHVRKNVDQVGMVVVCAKNQSHLARLVDFLKAIGAGDYPALIMDDEADQATLDTTLNARTSGRVNAPKFGSTINRRTVKNDAPDEEGRSVAEVLRHFVFLQVTATPYALLLQNTDNPLRPQFTKLLEPGKGYTGGERFFSTNHLDDELAPLVFVPDGESAELERGAKAAPSGLTAALATFLVASSAQALVDGSSVKAQNFLCHTSQKRQEHDRLAGLIRDYLEVVGDALRKPTIDGEVALDLGKAVQDLRRTQPATPSLDLVLQHLRKRLPLHNVIVVNSDGANAEFSRGMNFIIGGNILGRGLTIDNLLVTYYLRHAKVSQMDTMLQHARMFGYRGALMPYTRVYLPERLAVRFHRIHTAEQHLRALLADPGRRARLPVEVSEGLRATRPAVLDMGTILAYTPGQHLYPTRPLTAGDAHKQHERARARTLRHVTSFGEEREQHDVLPVSLDEMIELVSLLPFDRSDEDSWDPSGIEGALRSSKSRFKGMGFLYCRKMRRTKFTEGALSGEELRRLRGLGKPVLCVFLDVGRKYVPPSGTTYSDEFIYPSFVLPEGDEIPSFVFDASD